MLWIHLPRVYVEHHRMSFAIHRPERAPRKSIGKYAKVSSAGYRQVATQYLQRRDRKLHESLLSRCNLIRPARRVRNTVAVVEYGKDARVVADAQLAQHLKRPKRVASY